MNDTNRGGGRRRSTQRALVVLACSVLGLGGIAAADGAADAETLELTFARSGHTPVRVAFDTRIGESAVVTDARAAVRQREVRTERTERGLRLTVVGSPDDTGDGAGDLVRVSVAEVPGGIKAATVRVLGADGEPIGHAEVYGEALYATWYAGDAARHGGDVVIEFDALGLTVLPQRRMGEPVRGLSADELMRWTDGRTDYDTQLTPELGLGPIFNKENCGNCHNAPLGGTGTQKVTRFGLSGKDGFDPLVEFGGPLLQAGGLSIGCLETLPDFKGLITAQRVTNGMMGYGLVEAILDADIQTNESSGPGVSGRAHMVEPLEAPGTLRVGRFGWKASIATILSFSGDAAMMEMGLSNRLIPFDNDPNGMMDPPLESCDTVPDPEDFADENGREFIDRVTDFQRFLAQPPQTPRSGMAGEAIFNQIGCVQCHARDFITPDDPALEEAFRGIELRPYSDFLLHDMGLAADFIPEGDATAQELRTPPLWGLRRRLALWHDGRFTGGTFESRVVLAIEEHGAFLSEGAESAAEWAALSGEDKDAVLAFLASLGRPEFDATGDDRVLLADFVNFAECHGQTGITPDDACAIHDLDQDGDVDEVDLEGFLSVYDGPFEDCNGNGISDLADIINGVLPDENGDGIVDECTIACPADFDQTGAVDFNDLLVALAAFDATDAGDTDGDGDTDFSDLLNVLAAFGPCS
jgi:hypothetical protein